MSTAKLSALNGTRNAGEAHGVALGGLELARHMRRVGQHGYGLASRKSITMGR